MKLEGSCHCGAVSYSVESETPYPYNHCYCTKCRKTGGSGWSINIMGRADSLEVTGQEHITVYRAKSNHREKLADDGLSPGQLHFCKHCSAALWVFSPEYPEAVYPRASSIDTPLPPPPVATHLMTEFKASWVPLHLGVSDKQFRYYPDEGIADWHARLGLGED